MCGGERKEESFNFFFATVLFGLLQRICITFIVWKNNPITFFGGGVGEGTSRSGEQILETEKFGKSKAQSMQWRAGGMRLGRG